MEEDREDVFRGGVVTRCRCVLTEGVLTVLTVCVSVCVSECVAWYLISGGPLVLDLVLRRCIKRVCACHKV